MNPQPGDQLLIAIIDFEPDRWGRPDESKPFTRLEVACVFNGARSAADTHVLVRLPNGATTARRLNERGTDWVPALDREAVGAMLALRALAGAPPVKPATATAGDDA